MGMNLRPWFKDVRKKKLIPNHGNTMPLTCTLNKNHVLLKRPNKRQGTHLSNRPFPTKYNWRAGHGNQHCREILSKTSRTFSHQNVISWSLGCYRNWNSALAVRGKVSPTAALLIYRRMHPHIKTSKITSPPWISCFLLIVVRQLQIRFEMWSTPGPAMLTRSDVQVGALHVELFINRSFPPTLHLSPAPSLIITQFLTHLCFNEHFCAPSASHPLSWDW